MELDILETTTQRPCEFYEFDEEIDYMRVWVEEGGGQGCGILTAQYYFKGGKDEYYEVNLKGNAVSLMLSIQDDGLYDDNYCADPRIIASYIEASWLAGQFYTLVKGGGYGSELSYELREAYAFKPFTKEEALDWLEKNRFIGANSIRNVGVAQGKTGESDVVPHWHVDYPGWDIHIASDWFNRPKLYYLSPCGRRVYNHFKERYQEFWTRKKAEFELWEKWRDKSDLEVYLESKRLEEEDDPLPLELDDLYFDMSDLFYKVLKDRIERGQDEYYKLHPEELQYVNFFEEN